jgi:hypothetical protein
VTLGKQSVARTKILPLLITCCTQDPVRIDVQKLYESTEELSLLEIAWLQSISEMYYSCYETIEWESQALLARVNEIQIYLYHFSKGSEGESEECESTDEERERYMLQTRISFKNAINYFDSISLINRLAENKVLLRAISKLERHRLSEANLTTELLRNLRCYCHNSPVTLIPEQLPERIWLKILANYLAISSKRYQDYGDVDYDEKKLIYNAISR